MSHRLSFEAFYVLYSVILYDTILYYASTPKMSTDPFEFLRAPQPDQVALVELDDLVDEIRMSLVRCPEGPGTLPLLFVWGSQAMSRAVVCYSMYYMGNVTCSGQRFKRPCPSE